VKTNIFDSTGLVAAHELIEAGLNTVIVEATNRIGGCWNTQANLHSHVTVAEPSYRFPMPDKGFRQSDWTGRDELLSHAEQFVEARRLRDRIHFKTRVVSIREEGNGFCISSISDRHGTVMVTKAKAVFLAVGAQVQRREVTWPGEDNFHGSIRYGSGDEVDPATLKKQSVVIIGAGSFAVEQARVALLHGAKHVSIIAR